MRGSGSFFSRERIHRFSNPPHLGVLCAPDGHASGRDRFGEALDVFLSVREGTIAAARFETLGSIHTVACGNAAMELAEGRTLIEALEISAEVIEEAMGGLPCSHKHGARLAADTLHNAVLICRERARRGAR